MQAQKNPITNETPVYTLEESVSLWVDGELSIDADQLDTPYGRQLWDNYHLIGDVLRSDELALEPSELFYARLSKAIDDEPIVFAPRAQQASRWRRIGISLAVLTLAVFSSWWYVQPTSIQDAPLLANADEMWADYIDAHHSLTGLEPANYVSYSLGN